MRKVTQAYVPATPFFTRQVIAISTFPSSMFYLALRFYHLNERCRLCIISSLISLTLRLSGGTVLKVSLQTYIVYTHYRPTVLARNWLLYAYLYGVQKIIYILCLQDFSMGRPTLDYDLPCLLAMPFDSILYNQASVFLSLLLLYGGACVL